MTANSKKKDKAKDVILPHSKHKLDLYKNYLERYLSILLRSKYTKSISLYDLFCGRGQYKDGNIGSPLITNECVQAALNNAKQYGFNPVPISISVNDKSGKNIKAVKELLEKQKRDGVDYNYTDKEASEQLKFIAADISKKDKGDKCLVFIDPYGYSQVTKADLQNLIQNENTEVILFLPVANIYRSYITALTDEEEKSCYEGLRRFIYSLFPQTHKIYQGEIENNLELIQEIKQALRLLGDQFVCSHNIERTRGMYYAIFFLTSNMLGFEKMVESKWKVDPNEGAGHKHKKATGMMDMFTQAFQEEDQYMQMERLKAILLTSIRQQGEMNNNQLYELALRSEFKPAHAVKCLNNMIKDRVLIPQISSPGVLGGVTAEKHINYDNWRDNVITATFKSSR